MVFKVSTDIGGTFTDIAVLCENGDLFITKTPTVPESYQQGVMNAVEKAANLQNKSTNRLLEQTSRFVHGSTISTNAIIEGKTAKIGLICTRGHKDILTLREGGEKHNPYNLREHYKKPFVPRHLTMEVTERVNSEGDIVVPLEEEDVYEAIKTFKKQKVEAIAIALLWDIVNPTHAQLIKKIISEEWPEIPTVFAHEFNPCIRELKRTSSVVINASLIPVIGGYFSELKNQLDSAGYNGELSLINSAGGIMGIEEMIKKPIYSIDSGPTMAPVAGLEIARLEKGTDNLIVVDMGGTSFDVSLIRNGEIPQTRDAKINQYSLGIPKCNIKTIGSGGGSIAWVDGGGMLHVGPKSAGANPGPACYGIGGTKPTLTDANLVLGYLNENYFAGGSIKLYRDLAEKAIVDHIAKPLGMSLQEAAYNIWHISNTNMVASIEEATIGEGIDPRKYTLLAGGGAAGLHVAQICNQLGVEQAILPKVAGTLSAAGGVFADVVGDYSLGKFAHTAMFDYKGINNTLEELEKWAQSFLDRSDTPENRRTIEFFCEARYPYQVSELSVPLRVSRFHDQNDLDSLIQDFHQVHEQVMGIKEDTGIECINWRVKAVGHVDKPVLNSFIDNHLDISTAVEGKRAVYLGPEIGEKQATVYRGDKLPRGAVISFEQVAIIEEDTTTLLCLPNCQVTVSSYGNYNLEFKN
ncbi:hydantoinase/oxoprolinase family protein [Bacillus sp. JJ1533]|uniref:hydantoinase/oxoprolinase family protein n=1 Tax=Bacillus sp. JJ1533 TaxID=3122959 RepID=UPI002FFE7A20